jgi:hypothetical protein
MTRSERLKLKRDSYTELRKSWNKNEPKKIFYVDFKTKTIYSEQVLDDEHKDSTFLSQDKCEEIYRKYR